LLAAADTQDSNENGIFDQIELARLDLTEDRAAQNRDFCVGAETPLRSNGDALPARGVENRIGKVNEEGIEFHFIAIHLDGADDAVFDGEAGGAIDEDEAGIIGAVGFAIAFEAPAGDKGGMANRDTRDAPFDFHSAARDEEAVNREIGTRLARNAQ